MNKEEKIKHSKKVLERQIAHLKKRIEITKEASKEAKKIRKEIIALEDV